MTIAFQPVPLLCHSCLLRGKARRAWTVGHGTALCVRCAVESQVDDDMDQHDLEASLYEELRLLGHGDAY